LKKTVKSPYLSNRLIDFDMKFGTVTQIVLYRGQTVKISNFFQTKMAAAAILKNHKNAISQ